MLIILANEISIGIRSARLSSQLLLWAWIQNRLSSNAKPWTIRTYKSTCRRKLAKSPRTFSLSTYTRRSMKFRNIFQRKVARSYGTMLIWSKYKSTNALTKRAAWVLRRQAGRKRVRRDTCPGIGEQIWGRGKRVLWNRLRLTWKGWIRFKINNLESRSNKTQKN